MWFIFPQIAGLGHSQKAVYYALSGVDEARAYLAHPVLGPRLRRCCEVLCERKGLSAEEIFGDVDAMKLVSEGVNALRSEGRSFLVITHYQRLLDHIKPDVVHIMADGRIIKTGGPELALEVEQNGYADILAEMA